MRAILPAILSASLMAAPALWAQPAPLGPESELDPRPGGIYIQCPAVAAREDGGFLTAWMRMVPPQAVQVLARAGDSGGGLGDLRVLDGTGQASHPPLLAFSEDGYTALWRRIFLEPPDRIHAPHLTQELDAQGSPAGEILDLARPGVDITPRPGGGTITVWKSGTTLNVQLLTADGKPVAPPAKLRLPKAVQWIVAPASNGDLVVLWHSITANPKYVDLGYAAQRFNAQGRPVGKIFSILPGRGGHDFRIDLLTAALGPDGTLAVASAVDDEPNALGPGRVTLRTFDAAGHLIGGPYAVTSAVRDPHEISFPMGLAVAPDGRILLIWAQYRDPYRIDGQARLFTRAATPDGEPLRLPSENSVEPFVQCANVARAGDSWVVAWRGASGSYQDPTRTESIYVRGFTGDPR
jgi:hypothetical protein